jgi:hypothetical protein
VNLAGSIHIAEHPPEKSVRIMDIEARKDQGEDRYGIPPVE